MEELLPLLARCTGSDTYQIVLRAPTDPEEAEKRITLIRRGLAWQIERFRNHQAFHENVEQDELSPCCSSWWSALNSSMPGTRNINTA